MKFSLLISGIILFGTPLGAQDKPFVLASASMIADIAEQIGKTNIKVESIVPIGGDPHLYEPTPGDARKVADANLILVNGLTFEGWIDELIENAGTDAKVVTVTNGIQPIMSTVYENAADPHAWMDAENGIIYANNIKNALLSIVPDNQQIIANHKDYVENLKKVDQTIIQEINSIPISKRYLITSHDAFHYYGKKYGIKTEAILGTSTDSDAQTSDLIRLNKLIKTQNIPAVFIETTVNPKLLQRLAQDNNIHIGGKLYSDSIGNKDSPAPTYIDMLLYNTRVIVKALTRSINDEQNMELESSESNTLLIVVLATVFLGGFIIVLKYIK